MRRTRERPDPERERAAEPERSSPLPMVDALPSAIGNAAFARLVARQPKGGTLAPPAALHGRKLGEALEQRVDRVGANAASRQDAIVKAIKDGVGQLDGALKSLNAVCDLYAEAYERAQRAIKKAESDIAAQEAFAGMILGVMIGTGVGSVLSAIGPLSKTAIKTAETLGEMSGEVAEWAIGKGIEKLGSGSDAKTGAEAMEQANPLLKRLAVYKDIDDARREVALLATQLTPVNSVDRWVTSTKADCRELAVSGKHGRLTEAELERRVQVLERMDGKLAGVDTATRAVADRSGQAAAQAARSLDMADKTQMERHLLIRWMAALDDDERKVLGSGDLRSYLQSLQIKGPFVRYPQGESKIGWYKGDDDLGVERAQFAVMALDMIGKTGTAVVAPDEYGSTRPSRTPDLKIPGFAWNPATPYRDFGVICDEEVQHGDQVLITGVFGQSKVESYYLFYGRPVNARGKSEKQLDADEKGRRRQLI